MMESEEVLVARMRFRLQDRADLRIDLALDAFVFGGCFDDQIRLGERGNIGGAGNPGKRSVALFGGDLATGDLTGDVGANGGDACLNAFGGNIVNDDLVASQCADLRNAAAHLPRANNANRLDCHVCLPQRDVCILLFMRNAGLGPAFSLTLDCAGASYFAMRNNWPIRSFSCVKDAPNHCTIRRYASKRLFKLRQGLEQVADETVVGHLEDRRFLVLVDGNDDLQVLHAGQMLDGTGNAAGDVKIRGNHLAGLANLPVVGGIARIDGSARGANGGTELVGDGKDDFLELFRRAQCTTTGDDDLGGGEFRDGQTRTGRRRRKPKGPDFQQRQSFRRRPNRRLQPAAKDAVRTVITFLASVD